MQSTVDRLALAVENAQRRHHGVYLGFHGLRQLADVYDLLEIWCAHLGLVHAPAHECACV